MATAVQPQTAVGTTNPQSRLALTSILATLFVLAGVAVAGYVLPRLWAESVAPILSGIGGFFDVALQLVTSAAVIAAFVWLGSKLVGDHPPHGIRGGIFLGLSLVITAFFLIRAIGLNFEGSSIGLPLTAIAGGAMLAGSYLLMAGQAGQRLMIAVEDQGWLSTFNYKKTQGIKARRWTLLGFLTVGWTGVWSLKNSRFLADASAPLQFTLPFTDFVLTVLPSIGFTVPLLLAVAVFWLAWRAVQVPPFADFLIATEAEMNKVSWSSRKRLGQDTIVVLVTVFLLTAFLFVIDWFWGTLLSSELIGVLPSGTETKAAEKATLRW